MLSKLPEGFYRQILIQTHKTHTHVHLCSQSNYADNFGEFMKTYCACMKLPLPSALVHTNTRTHKTLDQFRKNATIPDKVRKISL